MMPKSGLFVILLVLVINANIVNSSLDENPDTGETMYDSGTPEPADYANPEAYSSKPSIFDNPNFKASEVPPEHIGKIPPEKLGDPNQVQDQSKLTFEQLSYGDNYNKVGDKSKLDSDVRDRFLSEKTNRDVKTELPPDTKGTAEYDSFTFDKVDTLQMDNNIVSGATNVVYSNGILTADHADSYVNTGSISSDIDYLEVQPTVFKVKKADSVISGCIEVNDAENSEFKIYSNAV